MEVKKCRQKWVRLSKLKLVLGYVSNCGFCRSHFLFHLCLVFSEYFRFQYLHFLYHMHSPEYKESLKRQIEEQRVWKLIVVYSVRIPSTSHAKAICLHCYIYVKMLIFVPLSQARKKELTGKVNQAEKLVDSLQKEALGNLKNRMNEVHLPYNYHCC